MVSPVDVTYLADSVLLLRYFEAAGRVRRAISVIKKRAGAHEDTIRELRITQSGVALGEPLRGFQGVLSGIPTYMLPTGTDFDGRKGLFVWPSMVPLDDQSITGR